MIKYIFRDTLTIKNAAKADAQKIGEALAKIAALAQGELTPPAVLDAARASRHVLHQHFEWDDSVAANAYRVDQARTLIRCVEIVSEATGDDPVQAFISITDKAGTSYRTMQAVLDSVELQVAALRQAERDMDAFTKRYRMIEDVCDLIKQARDLAATRRSKLESRASN